MTKKVIELLDSVKILSMLALMIVQKSIGNDQAQEVIEDALKEVWKARQALSEIIRVQDKR